MAAYATSPVGVLWRLMPSFLTGVGSTATRLTVPVGTGVRMMAASTHFVNTLGARTRPNGSAVNWYAFLPNANLRYLRCLWWIRMWKYASFKSIVIVVSILNRSGMNALFNT